MAAKEAAEIAAKVCVITSTLFLFNLWSSSLHSSLHLNLLFWVADQQQEAAAKEAQQWEAAAKETQQCEADEIAAKVCIVMST